MSSVDGSLSAQDARIQSVLLSALALPQPHFSANAVTLHQLLAGHLARQASLALRSASTINDGNTLYLPALAVFQKLAGLQTGIPIDINSLHDFLVVYASRGSDGIHESREAKLARKIARDLLRKKPSLARGIETQVVPSYIGVMQELAQTPAGTDVEFTLNKTKVLLRSMETFLLRAELQAVKDIMSRGGGDESVTTQFWTALQILYDTTLPQTISPAVPATVDALHGSLAISTYIELRQMIIQIFKRFSTNLHIETLLALLEGEAAADDLPASLADLPLISMFNLSLLADAEKGFAFSQVVMRRSDIPEREKAFIVNGIRSTLAGAEEVQDGMELFKSLPDPKPQPNGKGKGRQALAETSSTMEDSDLSQQIQAILPDTSADIITHLLALPSFTDLSSPDKIEKAVGMILEGHPEASASSADTNAPTTQPTQEIAPAQVKSSFAQARSNIFDDRIDVSRLRRGKQDIENDTFLPADLKNAILSAAARHSDDEDSDHEGGTQVQSAAFLEDLGGDEDPGAITGRVRVKDNIDEESDAEDEDDRQHAPRGSAAVSRQDSRPGTPIGSSGLPSAVESRFLSLYATNAALFSRDARKTPARADLRKETNCSDEQIEGWRTMFERNPKKDKILMKATEFRGNEKGLEVRPGKPGGGGKGGAKPQTATEGQTTGATAGASGGEASRGGSNANRGGRGRGRGGRGGQSEQRRRGNDRKLAKTGGIVG